MNTINQNCLSLYGVRTNARAASVVWRKQARLVVLLAASLFFASSTLSFAESIDRGSVTLERGQFKSNNNSSVSTSGYFSELARIDKELHSTISFAATRSGSWLLLERVANSYLKRAKLSGSIDDYLAAQSTLQQAFDLAGSGGPVLLRASLNYSLHKVPEVDSDLNAAQSALIVSKATQEKIDGIRADILFQQGEYAQAKQAYKNLDATSPSVANAARLAHYHQQVGEYEQAESWFNTAEQRIKGSSAYQGAWLKLQLGILDLERGRYNDALAHYQDALRQFPDFWLVQEHIAEIDAILGRYAAAEAMYRQLIPSTGSPLFMAALADVLEAQNTAVKNAESIKWRKKANNAYTVMMGQIPELVSGHAIEYFLETENSARTLELAQDNYRLRPNGQSALLLVQAYVVRDRHSDAMALLEKILASPHRSASLHATASLLLRADGQIQRADKQKALAAEINPYAMGDVSWLEQALAG